LRVAGGIGDLAVKGEILIDGGAAGLDRGIDRGETFADLLDLGGGGTFGGQAGGFDLDAGPQFHDVKDVAERRMLVKIDPKRAAHIVGHKGADALAGDDQPVGPQCGDRLADHGAGHASGDDHLLLGRQARPRRQFTAGDIGGQPRHQLGSQPARRFNRPQQRKIFWQTAIPLP
jgi:hypothetical protein